MKLDKRETATVLAALRLFQKLHGGHPGTFRYLYPGIYDIATDEGDFLIMPPEEVDDLCEKINCPKLD